MAGRVVGGEEWLLVFYNKNEENKACYLFYPVYLCFLDKKIYNEIEVLCMRKFWIIFAVFLFVGCELNQQEHYLVAVADNNYSVFYNPDNKTLSSSEQLAYNTTITVSWYLLPQSLTNAVFSYDENGFIKADSPLQIILEPSDCLDFVSIKQWSLEDKEKFKKNDGFSKMIFKAKKEGTTKVVIKSDKYGSATVYISSVKIQ